MAAAMLSVVPALVSPAVAGGASGTIKLVSPAKPVMLGSTITLKGRFKNGGHRAFVIQKRALFSLKWRAIKSTNGTTNRYGVYQATYKPKHTFTYRAVLKATATKPQRISKKLKVQLTATWSQVASGSHHTCGIRFNQTLWCWGNNAWGELGIGTSGPGSTIPLRVNDAATNPSVAQKWSAVSAGYDFTCGIRTDTSLWCWGNGSGYVLGQNNSTEYDAPQQVVGPAAGWTAVSASDYHVCAINSGSLYCWGDGGFGELGYDSQITYESPGTAGAVGSSTTWTSVSTGTNYTCGIDAGALFCWGDNSVGQLGYDTSGIGAHPTTAWVPTQVGSDTDWTRVSSSSYEANTPLINTIGGSAHTCGIRSGALYCWGDNTIGQLGDGTTVAQSSPGPQPVGGASDWTSVTAGGGFTCGVENSADLSCWGYNNYGQLGEGDTSAYTSPAAVTNTYTAAPGWNDGTATAPGLSAGAGHVCAIHSDSTLWCWGWDGYEQLGNGTKPNRLVPRVTDAG